MNKLKKMLLGTIMAVALLVPGASVFAYTVENKVVDYGTGYTWQNKYVVAHETANATSTVDNEVAFMKNNWQNAFVTHYVGGGGRVIQVAPTGKISWGAGGGANSYAYAQVELARDKHDPAAFAKNYPVYVNLLRDLAKHAGVPVVVDAPGNGIKSHEWVSYNLGGTDHADPYGFLASMGVSRAQFAKDISTGLPETGQPAKPVEPAKPTPKPQPNKPAPTPQFDKFETKSGQYKFTVETKIRNGLGVNGQYSGVNYSPGEVVNYDRVYRNVDGYDWLSYISYGGQRRYVAMVNPNNTPQKPVEAYTQTNGSFTFKVTTKIRNGAGLSGQYSGVDYLQGQTVNYDRIYRNVDGYDWLSYISYGGQRRFVAML